MTVLEQFGALGQFRVAEESGCGVITTADAGYFTGLQLLCATCAGKVPLAVFDAGLTVAQRAWCEARRARVLAMPELAMPRTERMWQTWNKPRVLRASPFRTTLWLDADCLVVGDLNPLFDRARRGPFGVKYPYTAATMANNEELYRRFPVRLRIPEEQSANAGVLGFGRDKQAQELLASWEGMVVRAAGDPEIRALLCWEDQGALHWTIQAHGYTDAIVAQPGWNRYLWLPGRKGPEHFLQQLKIRPDDVVLHAILRPKPWKSWGELT
jgi:hypothetical protein